MHNYFLVNMRPNITMPMSRSLSQPFQRRWSMRIPSQTSHSSHNNSQPKPIHRNHHRPSDHQKKDRFEGVGDDYKDGDDSDRALASTKTDATVVSTLEFKPVQSSLHGKVSWKFFVSLYWLQLKLGFLALHQF